MPEQPSHGLSGRTAVITGGGQGIGAAIARAFAGCGARVVVDGRHELTLKQVCADIVASGGEAIAVPGSVTDAAHLDELMAAAANGRSAFDVLVNNAGTAGPTAPLLAVTREQWDDTLAVNLTGAFLACKAAIPYLQASGRGRIVNIGSGTGKRPLANRTPYAAAKLGLVGLTRTLAVELGPLGITVNVVSPFLVENARLDNVITTMAAERGVTPAILRAELQAETALDRPVSEDEVAAAVRFLCSDEAGGITGQDLNVSAGSVMY